MDQIVTVHWFNLIQNELFFPKLPLIRYDTFKNNHFRAKNIIIDDLLFFHLWETGQNTGKFHLCALHRGFNQQKSTKKIIDTAII